MHFLCCYLLFEYAFLGSFCYLFIFSPMTDRCFFIHDKRVGSPDHGFWLHRTLNDTLLRSSKLTTKKEEERDDGKICTTISCYPATRDGDAIAKRRSNHHTSSSSTSLLSSSHIDFYYHSKASHDVVGHPFGKRFLDCQSPDLSFPMFYMAILNADSKFDLLSKFQVYQIVNKMRHSYHNAKTIYRYNHTHKLVYHGELCKLIQTRAFDITSPTEVKEIPMVNNKTSWDPDDFSNHGHRQTILVKEIMLEPSEDNDCEEVDLILLFSRDDGSNSFCPVDGCTASDSDVIQKLSNRELDKISKVKKKLNEDINHDVAANTLASLNVFHLCCPKDEQAYDFISEILHYFDILSRKERKVKRRSFNTISLEYLEQKFHSLMHHFALFSWPLNENKTGNAYDEDKVSLRKVDVEYHVGQRRKENEILQVADVWKHFIYNHSTQEEYDHNHNNNRSDRLQVFLALSEGHSPTVGQEEKFDHSR